MAQRSSTIEFEDTPLDEARRMTRGPRMNADIFAFQEMVATPDAEFSLNALRTELNRLTGGSWQVDLQSCGGASNQHVGFLWNGSRVALLQLTDVWELNGAASGPSENACTGNLRPGRYALAKTPYG